MPERDNEFSYWFVEEARFEEEKRGEYLLGGDGRPIKFTPCEAMFVFWAITLQPYNSVYDTISIKKALSDGGRVSFDVCPNWERDFACIKDLDNNPLIRRYYPLHKNLSNREMWKPNPFRPTRGSEIGTNTWSSHEVHICKEPRFILKRPPAEDVSWYCKENYRKVSKRIMDILGKSGAFSQGEICHVITKVQERDSIQEFITRIKQKPLDNVERSRRPA